MMLDQLVIPGFDEHRKALVPSVAEIQREVARYFHIPVLEMVSQRRSRDVARPRQVAMYLTKQLTPKSLPNIGRLFGNRDHTTVIHACRQVARLIGEDQGFADDVAVLEGRL